MFAKSIFKIVCNKEKHSLEYHNTSDWKPYFELLDRIAGNSIDCHCCFGRTRRGSWAEVAGRLDRIGYC